MPRPLPIVFNDGSYYETFLTTLSEAHRRFGIQILSYCLMDNHYHLLVKTPEANCRLTAVASSSK